MNMEDGGLFGGWALTVWFCQKQHSFIRNTLISIPMRCQLQFMTMLQERGLDDIFSFFSFLPANKCIRCLSLSYSGSFHVAEIAKILQCPFLLPMPLVLLQFGSRVSTALS